MSQRVSVIVPAYNSEPYLAEALRSVIEQTLPPDEIIVVDDGSTDRTWQVVAGVAAAAPMPLHYVKQANQGPAAARNQGLRLATGDLVAFMDADDLWLPWKAERQLEILRAHPHAGAVWGGALAFAGDPPLQPGAAIPAYPLVLLQSMLIRRETLTQVGPFTPDLRVGEDIDWLLRALEQSVMIVVHHDLVIYYRRHAKSLTNDRDYVRLNVPVLRIKLLKRSLDRRRACGEADVRRTPLLLVLPGAGAAYQSDQGAAALVLGPARPAG